LELNKFTITEIFRKNFTFPIEDTVLGPAIRMDALSAFYFANVTGAGYLDDPILPFSPKGLLNILREAFQYNIVTGIFDKNEFLYSPVKLRNDKPYLFEGDKYLILIEGRNEADFKNKLKEAYDLLTKKDLRSTDYLFFRIEVWKKGNGMESFLEYLACELFKEKNYIVENQIPLVHAVGTPDFGGVHIPQAARGFHIIELAMIRITGNTEILDDLNVNHIIVGEAKTSTTSMDTQLKKYLDTTVFFKGYEMHPEKKKPTEDCFGILNIGEDYSINCREPLMKYLEKGNIVFDFDEYMDWYINYLKFYIIANFTNDELKKFIEERKSSGNYNQLKIIEVIRNTSLQEIIENVKEVV